MMSTSPVEHRHPQRRTAAASKASPPSLRLVSFGEDGSFGGRLAGQETLARLVVILLRHAADRHLQFFQQRFQIALIGKVTVRKAAMHFWIVGNARREVGTEVSFVVDLAGMLLTQLQGSFE